MKKGGAGWMRSVLLAAAALDPLRHWPIVLVGLLGKILGPIGFLSAVAGGTLPLSFGLTILTNDLIWWAPFTLILLRAYQTRGRKEHQRGSHPQAPRLHQEQSLRQKES